LPIAGRRRELSVPRPEAETLAHLRDGIECADDELREREVDVRPGFLRVQPEPPVGEPSRIAPDRVADPKTAVPQEENQGLQPSRVIAAQGMAFSDQRLCRCEDSENFLGRIWKRLTVFDERLFDFLRHVVFNPLVRDCEAIKRAETFELL
jgi:hypothetical protein